jgi:hypothetical protein
LLSFWFSLVVTLGVTRVDPEYPGFSMMPNMSEGKTARHVFGYQQESMLGVSPLCNKGQRDNQSKDYHSILIAQ